MKRYGSYDSRSLEMLQSAEPRIEFTLDPLPTFGCVMLEISRIISGELCRNFIIWSKTRNINLVR